MSGTALKAFVAFGEFVAVENGGSSLAMVGVRVAIPVSSLRDCVRQSRLTHANWEEMESCPAELPHAPAIDMSIDVGRRDQRSIIVISPLPQSYFLCLLYLFFLNASVSHRTKQ
jgi:hypothetical protein